MKNVYIRRIYIRNATKFMHLLPQVAKTAALFASNCLYYGYGPVDISFVKSLHLLSY
jgi:hypothetical protein